MRKLTVIFFLALFAIGFTSCTDTSDTDPVTPEVQIEDPGSTEGEEEESEVTGTWLTLGEKYH